MRVHSQNIQTGGAQDLNTPVLYIREDGSDEHLFDLNDLFNCIRTIDGCNAYINSSKSNYHFSAPIWLDSPEPGLFSLPVISASGNSSSLVSSSNDMLV